MMGRCVLLGIAGAVFGAALLPGTVGVGVQATHPAWRTIATSANVVRICLYEKVVNFSFLACVNVNWLSRASLDYDQVAERVVRRYSIQEDEPQSSVRPLESGHSKTVAMNADVVRWLESLECRECHWEPGIDD